MLPTVLERITPLILTRDESANIGRTLTQLGWAKEIVVVDSFSEDDTVAIASSFANVRVVQRQFDTMERQWNFGVEQVATEWMLTLDADYFVPEAFVREIAALEPADDVAGYEARFVYAIDGRPLRATLYTPRVVLLRKNAFSIYQDGHTQRVRITAGRVEPLREPLIHDDRKSWPRFVARQKAYMRQEAAKLRAASWSSLPWSGRMRKMRLAPLVIVPYTLLAQRLILDGRAGLRYAKERFVAEWILARELWR